MCALRTARPPGRPFPTRAVVGALERTAEGEAERRLVVRLQAGDGAALDLLISAHASRVYRVALGITGREDHAEHVARTVFEQLVSGGASGRPARALRDWLYRATTRAALRVPAGTAAPRGVPSPQAPGDEAVPAVFRRALARLTAADRAAVILKDGEALSNEAVALALGESTSAVRRRIHRARVFLCARLGASLPAGTPTRAH